MKKKLILYVVVPLVFLIIALLVYCTLWKIKENTSFPDTKDTVVVEPVLMYGIPVDSFEIIGSSVQRDEVLSGILSRFSIPTLSIKTITDSISRIFDVTSLRKGNSYTVFISPDSLFLRYFIYEHSPVDFLLVEIRDSNVYASLQQKAINIKLQTTEIEVRSSLWNDMKDARVNPLLALELSEIYAWTVDFFMLRKGDVFQVKYEEKFVDSVSLGIGKIHAACYSGNGKPIYAIPFEQDGRESYFDQEGESLRRAFLKAPLRYSRIASRFSHSRMHPILRIRRPHFAVDYSAPTGTPVQSIGDGKVLEMGYHGGSGNMVKIRHNGVYTSAYLHLSAFAKGLRKGQSVMQGQTIGYVGSTGLSTGPHLDFRVYKNGKPMDPLKMEAPAVEPVKEEYREVFDSLRICVMDEFLAN